MRRPTDPPERPAPRTLIAADSAALAAFVVVGALSHHDAGFLVVLVRNLVPIGLIWGLVALAVGTYRRRTIGSLVLTWVLAVPSGILVRSWVVGAPTGHELVVFLLVGSGFSLLFLAFGRVLVALTARAAARRATA